MAQNQLTNQPAEISKNLSVFSEIAQKLDSSVMKVLGQEDLNGFEKAFLIATATAELKKALTPEYMKPIMELQGSRLGFKTDKDKEGGYPVEVVKNCLIEAVLMGVQPFGNQFNIIAGGTYITKEGFGFLLSKYPGLYFEITPAALPRINADKTSGAVIMRIIWSINNSPVRKQELDIPVKMNSFLGTDAVIGKATRKARAWLYGTITGTEMPEGDIQDQDAQVVSSKLNEDGAAKAATATNATEGKLNKKNGVQSTTSQMEADTNGGNQQA